MYTVQCRKRKKERKGIDNERFLLNNNLCRPKKCCKKAMAPLVDQKEKS